MGVSGQIIMAPYCVSDVVMNGLNQNTMYAADITNVETK